MTKDDIKFLDADEVKMVVQPAVSDAARALGDTALAGIPGRKVGIMVYVPIGEKNAEGELPVVTCYSGNYDPVAFALVALEHVCNSRQLKPDATDMLIQMVRSALGPTAEEMQELVSDLLESIDDEDEDEAIEPAPSEPV